MSRRMLAIALLLCLCWTAPLLAETPAGAAAYRVTIVLYPGDDAAAVARRLAAMYRGTLETPVDSNGSFTISLSEAGAELMRRDPVVATAVPATAALPSSQRPVETNATTNWTLGPYQYDGSGNIRKVGSDFYVYDKLGRIVVSADAQPSVVHKQSYTYDAYGNLRTINTAGRAPATLDITGTSNRLASVNNGSTSASVGYDGAGNFTSYLGATYEYDALNVLRKSVTGGVTRSYVYTANDERIGTVEQTGSAIRSDWTIRDSGGQVLRRYSKENNGEWKWQEDYIYRGTQMLAAEIPDSPKTRHFHLDHLGTPRLITGNGGAEISRHTYHPFGEEIAPSATAREKKQFTGHERDSESLDYMHARFYAPFMGRFLSVDPGQDWDKHNPQSWNMYAYVRNDPLNATDPDGRQAVLEFVLPYAPQAIASYAVVYLLSRYSLAARLNMRNRPKPVLVPPAAQSQRPHIVTPTGVVLPGGTNVDLVPTATGTGWLQIHDEHDHEGAQPHTHRPEVNESSDGKQSVKRTDKPTTAADIDEADKRVKNGELRPRTGRADKGDRKPKPEPKKTDTKKPEEQ